ncbi:MAG: hypothetical protein KDD64_08965 [Bdellovibrionales bacterium]|nr:hypothetical protein [Bdellovibrionales bacterium]
MRISESPARNWRIAYLERAEFKALNQQLELDGLREVGTGFAVGAFYLKQSIRFDELTLPARTIVIPELEKGSNKLDRLRYGNKLVHEIAHAKTDANEGEARLESRNYLRRNGLSGPSKWQMFQEVVMGRSGSYSEAELFRAEKTLFGFRLGKLFSGLRCALTLFVEPYDMREDFTSSREHQNDAQPSSD